MNKLIKDLGIGLICALIILFLHELGVISFVFNNIWMIAIAAFIAFMLLILMRITRKICKADNKDIVKKIHIRFGMFTLILIVVVIGIVMFCHKPQDNKVVVPDLTGMEVVKASYKVYDAGLELNPIRVEKHLVTFQDPQAGSLVTKNSSVKVVIGKPSIEITHPIDNCSVNFSYCHITGKSSGMASNYPNLKIYENSS
jgi:c-di-AMP phosphodiesterase-like protein